MIHSFPTFQILQIWKTIYDFPVKQKVLQVFVKTKGVWKDFPQNLREAFKIGKSPTTFHSF